MRRGSFLLIFAASGAAALVYEVTWTRLLTLQLGHSVAAASTVLAAFMGGMAAGAAAGGRLGDRLSPTRALHVYAALEALIAVLAILLPFELHAFTPLFVQAYANGNGGTTFWLLRLVSTLLLLAIPAAAMGATFPIASRWFVRQAARAAGDAGGLYAANTVGAALGAVLAGFVLLPTLGLRGSTWIGVLLNLVAAGAALALARADWAALKGGPNESTARAPGVRRGPYEGTPTTPDIRRGPQEGTATTPGVRSGRPSGRPKGRGTSRTWSTPGTPRPWLAALALGASGFASLSLQIVWTRLLAMMLGPTTYAFSTIVAVFIAGIAMGSAFGARVATRMTQPLVGLAISLVTSVTFALIAAGLVDSSLLSMATIVARPDATFETVTARHVLLVGGLLLPMTVAFGAAFPFAVAIATRRDDTIAADLGLIYTVNTLGAIAGALLAGFALIPALGLHDTIRAVALITVLCAVVLVVGGAVRGRARLLSGVAAMGAIAAVVGMPSWTPLLLSSGAYKYAPRLQGPDLETALTAGRLAYYKEGASSTVAVRDLAGTISMAIDGKVDASNGGDMLTQRLLAHVPLLLHPAPRRVAILGMGSGVTAGSALTHPIEQATVLEISPEVVEASQYFKAENHDVLGNPRTRLIVGDGRTHLLLTTEPYDVIVSEPSNPWMAGIASLFTQQFFQAAKARLAPGGILCQWAHTYDISGADLRSIVGTFLSVFPEGTLWLVGEGDVLLVGGNEPMLPRLAGVESAWTRSGVAQDLAEVGARAPFAVLSAFVAEGSALAGWAAGAPIQTDDRTALEFSGPRSIFGRARDDNADALRTLAAATPRPAVVDTIERNASAADWRDRGWMTLDADGFRPAYDDFTRALALNPEDSRALEGLLRAATSLNRQSDAQALLTSLSSDPARLEARLALSRLLAARGAFDEAARIPLGVLQQDPGNVGALEQLASVLSDLSDAERLAPVVARLRQQAPESDAAHYYQAALYFLRDRPDLAIAEATAVIARSPGHARAQNLLGACLASLGRQDDARKAFRASISANPRDPATYANLGTLELQAGNRDLAAQHFAEALTVDPASESARQGLLAAQARP